MMMREQARNGLNNIEFDTVPILSSLKLSMNGLRRLAILQYDIDHQCVPQNGVVRYVMGCFPSW